MRDLTASDAGAWALCAAAFGFGAWGLQVGWRHGILDVHAWRQTHTAISAYEMAFRHGPFWTYRTPIFGPPWQWPLELPLFQWLAAMVSTTLPLDLDRAGRLISAGFYALAFVPGWFALDLLDIAPRHRAIVLALIWASPLYIFWSRTFMIESTATCLAVAHLALVDRATRDAGAAVRYGWLGSVAAVGALAGMVKVTAFTAFISAATALIVYRARRAGWQRHTALTILTCAVAVPAAATAAWLAFADHLKAGSELASEVNWAGERDQRFGTLAERFTARSWYAAPANVVLGRTRHTVVASGGLFALALLATLRRPRRFAACAACVALYFLPIAIFMRLFNVHVYYSYENGLFLAVAAGCGIVTLLEGPLPLRVGGVALFAAMLAGMASNYLAGYYVDQESGSLAPITLSTLTRISTAPDEVMLIYGLDYSPAVPYEAQRRAIMDHRDRSIDDPAIAPALARLAAAGGRIGAIVVCGGSRGDEVVRANIRRLGFPVRPYYAEPYCDLYLQRR
jgi:hypothetical protein